MTRYEAVITSTVKFESRNELEAKELANSAARKMGTNSHNFDTVSSEVSEVREETDMIAILSENGCRWKISDRHESIWTTVAPCIHIKCQTEDIPHVFAIRTDHGSIAVESFRVDSLSGAVIVEESRTAHRRTITTT